MRYALISDIHANLPALEAVLADIASREDVGATYHLGDLVGYAPWPNEVIATLRDGGHVAGPTVTLLYGNHVLNTVYVYEERPDAFLEKMGNAVGA